MEDAVTPPPPTPPPSSSNDSGRDSEDNDDDDDSRRARLDVGAAQALEHPHFGGGQEGLSPSERLVLRTEVRQLSEAYLLKHNGGDEALVLIASVEQVLERWRQRRDDLFRRRVWPAICDAYFHHDANARVKFQLLAEHVLRQADYPTGPWWGDAHPHQPVPDETALAVEFLRRWDHQRPPFRFAERPPSYADGRPQS